LCLQKGYPLFQATARPKGIPLRTHVLRHTSLLGSTGGALIGALLVGLMANYTGFLVPKVALFSNIALMVAILLWRPQGVYPVANR
jgi:predicted lipid-binding transport protein (Tim44 family)